MNNRATRVFLALAVGLFVYIFFFERHQNPKPAGQVLLLPGFSPAAVTGVDIVQADKPIISIEKSGKGWRMTSPVPYPAEELAIEDMLSALEKAQQSAFITPREIQDQGGGFGAYGLDKPAATIVLYEGTRRTELRLGVVKDAGARLYAQVAGSQGVAVTDRALAKHVPIVPDVWREHGVVNLVGKTFDRIVLKSGTRSLEFERESGGRTWMVTKPLRARADSGRITDLIQMLATARVYQFVSDSRADMESYGLQSPDVEVGFAQGTNLLDEVSFGRVSTNTADAVYALLSRRTNVVLVSSDLSKRARTLLTEFRDMQLAAFPATEVDRIEITNDERIVLQQNGTNGWRMLEPQPLPLDAGLMRNLLAGLGSLEIVEFVKDVVIDYAPYGLDKPSRSYALFHTSTNAAGPATNRLLLRLDFGKADGERVFTRRGDEKSVYAIRTGDLLRLPRAAFELRDRRVWDFNSSNLVSVEISQNGRTNKLVRNASQAWSNGAGALDQIEAAKLEMTLQGLGELKADFWAARGDERLAEHGITSETLRMTLELRAGDKLQTLTMQFAKSSVGGRRYAAVKLDGQTVIFQFPADKWDFLRDVTNGLILVK